MKKFISPTGSNTIFITQTTHGENANKPNDLSKQQAIDIKMYANDPVYSVCDGSVELVTTELGGYVSIIPTGAEWRTLSVHLKDYQVKAGQKVKAGDYLGRIALVKDTHLHFGCKNKNGLAPHPNPMDYFDRSIIFKTEYQSIADIWFNGKNKNGGINWSLFRDLSYDNNQNMGFKKGDVIIFTAKQNKRGGAGTGFADIGAYEKGDMAIIKDNPRTSQNAQFYGKGSSNKTNDKYTWYDTTPVKGGASSWVADMGKFRIATPEEINPTPTPEPPVPIPTPTPEPTNWEERYNEELEKNKGLVEDVRALEKEVKKLKNEIEQKEVEYRELREECDSLEEKNKMLEEERLLLQEKQDGELKDYRRWSWLINVLNSIFTRK